MSNSKDDGANELSAEDLDMAVGGASVEKVALTHKEENIKLTSKTGEQRRKHVVAPSEEKMKRD